MSWARFLSIVAALVTLGLGAGAARADDEVEDIALRFAERSGALVVKKLGLSPLLFDARAYERLEKNPLATVIAVRFVVYRKGRDEPIAYRFMSMRVAYDLWDAGYDVRIDGPKGRENARVERLDQAFKLITEFEDIPVADLDEVAIGPHHYLGIIAELNPVSEETQAELRRWLTRPAGTTRPSRGESFFGSFVSIFVNPPPAEADRIVRVRSQPFYRVPPR